MKNIVLGGYYYIVTSSNEKFYCFMFSESPTNLCYYLFTVTNGLIDPKDDMDTIPEAVYDQREVLFIAKNKISKCIPIYVVNQIHFKNDFIKYKIGRTMLFRIRNYYKSNSTTLSSITPTMFPFISYYDVLEKPQKTWIQLQNAISSPDNVFINERYKFNNFINCISDGIQHQLSLYNDDHPNNKSGSFVLSFIPLDLVMELFDFISILPNSMLKDINYKCHNEYRLLHLHKERCRSYPVTLTVSQISMLTHVFGTEFHCYPYRQFNNGAVDSNTAMVCINNANGISFVYDIFLNTFKIQFQIHLVSITKRPPVDSYVRELDDLKTKLLNKDFYDEVMQRTVRIMKVDLITQKLNNRSSQTKHIPIIKGYVIDSNVIKAEPNIVDNVDRMIEICYDYDVNQFDFVNNHIKYYCNKSKSLLNENDIPSSVRQKRKHNDIVWIDDKDDEDIIIENQIKNPKKSQ